MTSIGRSEYPEMTVSEAVQFVEAVKRDKIQTLPALGKVMGITSLNSGAAFVRFSALTKHYGLIDRRKNTVTLTPLAKRIVYPVSPQDRRDAIRDVALRVPLISQLFSSLGPSYHELDFPSRLMEITRAGHEEIAKKAPRVEKIYQDAARYLADSSGPAGPDLTASGESLGAVPSSQPESAPHHPQPLSSPGFPLAADERHWMYKDGDTVLRVEKNRKKLRTAIGVMNLWLQESPPDSDVSGPGQGAEGSSSP